MAIIQAVFAFLGRVLGKILNTVFGWATVLLFGKVPENRQIYLSGIAFGSVIWLVALLGIIFPSVATFLLAFVTLPSWVDRNWIRLIMLAAAIAVPPVVGVVAYFMLDPEDRTKGLGGKVDASMRGYPVTLSLAVTFIMLIAFAPIMQIQTMLRRWSSQHVPVIVKPQDYFGVVDEIQQSLRKGGWDTQRAKASWMLRLPTKIVTVLAGGSLKNFVAENLVELVSDKIDVALHPSDLIIRGNKSDVVHVRAIIAEQLAFSKAYMTWSEEAIAIEDRLDAIWDSLKRSANGAGQREAIENLRDVEKSMKTAKATSEEWEVLFREKLLVERGLLEVMAGITEEPTELTETNFEKIAAERAPTRASILRLPALPIIETALAIAAFAWRRLNPGR